MNRPKSFYYITHKDNLKSILRKGILSHSQIGLWARFLQGIKPIYAKDIIAIRKDKTFKDRSLWDYANLYFQPRNAMLYRVKEEFGVENIVVLQINPDIIDSEDIGITDGNATSNATQFFEDKDTGLKALDPKQFQKEYWNESDKRSLMAELLVFKNITPDKIIGIYTASEQIAETVKQTAKDVSIMPNPNMFFLPEYQEQISKQISLAKGDMFFSKLQTFTVSVNTVGVMGKGLASRAKYQFPDVYVYYQDLCRAKKLRMGQPALYKREDNFEKTLLEDTNSNKTENGSRWFLLFPTKNHWRESSPFEGIEKGLQWLSTNYKELGIQSLALPALGCGLGGLDWKDIGPLMCKYLKQMDINSCIYLPIEKTLPPEQLSPQFLLTV